MKHSLIAAALLAVALTACGEKKAEEAPAAAPAEATNAVAVDSTKVVAQVIK